MFGQSRLALLGLLSVISLCSPALSARLPKNDGIGPQITHDLTRSPTAHLLEQTLNDPCSEITPMYVDADAYKERCGEPRKGLCFELIGTKMSGSVIEPWLEPVHMTEQIIVADDSGSAFTIQDPFTAFEITFDSSDQLKFRYHNFDPATKCFDARLISRSHHHRLIVGETEDRRDLDTLHHEESSTRLCNDRLVITIKEK